MKLKTGIFKNIDIEVYHQWKAISKTTLTRFADSATPAHFKAYVEKEKDHLNLGNMIHMAILEPEVYKDKVVEIPPEVLNKAGGRSGNNWKEFKEKNADKFLLIPDDKKRIEYILEGLYQRKYNREAAELLNEKGLSEVSFVWEEWETSLLYKCRPDKLPGNKIVVDLKTAESAEPGAFAKAMANFKYHWSAALTLEGITEVTKEQHKDYRFVVIEIEPPYGIVVYQAQEDDIELAKDQMFKVKRMIADCIINDEWPCYPDGTHKLFLPSWARNNYSKQAIFD